MQSRAANTVGCCLLCLGRVRGFAKKRRRLTEYELYETPLRMRAWQSLEQDKGFYHSDFREMTPADVSKTVFVATKMTISSNAFWQRAAVGLGDVAALLSARQLVAACYSFAVATYQSDALARSLAPAFIKNAAHLRAGDLAVSVQSFGRMRMKHLPTLDALALAAANHERLNAKGYAMILDSCAALRYYNPALIKKIEAWAISGGVDSSSADECVGIAHSVALLTRPALYSSLISALSQSIAARANLFEAPQLVNAISALSKLRMSDPHL